MKMKIRPMAAFAVISAALLLSVIVANAARAATTSATATATIVSALSIENVEGLRFGSMFIIGSAGGNVTIAPDGTRTASLVTLLPATPFGAALFTVNGSTNRTYAISLPGGAVVIDDGLGNTLNVTSFTSSPSLTGLLDGAGTQDLTVGATVSVDETKPEGTYSGTFDVIVNFN